MPRLSILTRLVALLIFAAPGVHADVLQMPEQDRQTISIELPGRGMNMVDNGLHPLMAAGTAAGAQPHGAKRQIKVIVDNQALFKTDALIPRKPSHRMPRIVHKGLRQHQKTPCFIQPHFADKGGKPDAPFQPAGIPLCKLCDNHIPKIMAG